VTNDERRKVILDTKRNPSSLFSTSTIHKILAPDSDFPPTHHHAMKFAVVVAWLVAARTASAYTTMPKPVAFVPRSRTCTMTTTALAMAKGKENVKKPKKAPATKTAPAPAVAAPAKAAPAKKKK
jgi:hypothetical protein